MRFKNVFIIFILPLFLYAINQTSAQPVPDKYYSDLPFAMSKIKIPTFPERTISIVEFGAVADGHTLNTKAFNEAIRACAKLGGGKVIVPAGVWLTGPIKFESNINLQLESGALILFSRNRDDFPLINYPSPASKRYQVMPPIYGYKLENIAITGDGVIDGSGEVWRPRKREKYTAGEWKKIISSGGVVSEDGKMWWPSLQAMQGGEYLKNAIKERKNLSLEETAVAKDFLRPDMVVFYGCNNVLLDGPTFRNSPKFCINPTNCEDVVIRNIIVQNDWNAQNGDGIDIGSSHNVVIYNCVLDVGDDAICLKPGSIEKSRNWTIACENILIEDCIVYRGHGGFVIGSETFGGTRNVSVRNCTFIGTDIGLRFKSSRNRGGLTENIFIENIQMKNIMKEAISFDMYYEDDKPAIGETRIVAPITERTPIIKKFYIKNIVCNGADRAIFIQGLPEQFVSEIELNNVIISADKGVVCIDAKEIKFDNVKILTNKSPVFGLDNATDIIFRNVSYSDNIDLLMKVIGRQSENIQLIDTDITKAKKDFELDKDVNPKAVVIK